MAAAVYDVARKNGEHLLFEEQEDSAVPAEAGDGDAAEGVEERPFSGMCFEEGPIGGGIGKLQFPHARGDALADLPAHLPEPRPPQPEPRQRPLEEQDAFQVGHGRCSRRYEKSGSEKMLVKGKRFPDLLPLHDGKTHRIDIAEIMIVIRAQHRLCFRFDGLC